MGDEPIFAAPDITAERRTDGSWLLASRTPLGACERSVAAVLARWAGATPDAPFLCERAGGGWRQVSYAAAWSAARSIGQALLDRGLGPERPVMVLSGNNQRAVLDRRAADVARLHAEPPGPDVVTFG